MNELLAEPSGMAPAQVGILGRQDLSTLSKAVTRCGAKQPSMLLSFSGLPYCGTMPIGDWSGTAQIIDSWRGGTTAGSGGPANLAYGPTGSDTIVAAGRLQADASGFVATSTLVLEAPHGGKISDWTYKIAVLSLCAAPIGNSTTPLKGLTWSAGAFTLSDSQAAGTMFSGYTPTGDDWFCAVNAGTDVTFSLTGLPTANDTFTITDSAASTTTFIWKASPASSVQVKIGTTIAKCIKFLAIKIRLDTRFQIVGQTASSLTIRSATLVGPTATYVCALPVNTGTVAAIDYTIMSRAGTLGWHRIADKLDADTIQLTPERHDPRAGQLVGDVILNSGDITGTSATTGVWGYILPSSQAIYVENCTWTAATKTFTAPSGTPFSGYTPGSDDSIQILRGSNAVANGTYSKAVSTNGTTTVVATDDITSDAADGTTYDIIVWKPNAWRKATCTLGATNTTTVTLSATVTSTPLLGDFYIVYIDGGTGWAPTPQNNPEEAPTPSAFSTTACWHPYVNFGKSASASLHTSGNYANVFGADSGSLVNHAWHGTFQTAPRCFLSGDALQLTIGPIDSTPNGTAYCYEILLWPNPDPYRHWRLEAGVGNNSRLDSTVIKFQSPPFTQSGTRPAVIRLLGAAGGIQTVNTGSSDNYSQFWRCDIESGPSAAATNGPYVPGDPRFPGQRLLTTTALLYPSFVNASFNGTDITPQMTGVFNSVTYPGVQSRDIVVITSGDGWQPGPYMISTKTANKLTLVAGQGQPSASGVVTGYVPVVGNLDMNMQPTRWQLLVKTIHVSERGRFGYHGHYGGQPFSCTTGNGGTLLHYFGNKSFSPVAAGGTVTTNDVANMATYRLPTGPRLRCSSMRADWLPGGGT